ncbi:hypothetical protein HOD30_05655 [Candidatus Peregrinibacteria bacterium]|jgi:hypothetical protein|nr:hypothetical protein [Candidatus Peregrinibacteria bacterium]MBT4632014.1 hypothetical protein [Candidatus Peregrinibacteria bacterium]MBT5824099.1 hypothetical protein [Candidatus Peregrinibacteria bacterium]
MKKILSTLILSSLLFTACGGASGTSLSDEDTLFYTYETAEFSIETPRDWETITAFPAEYPKEVRVAFRDNLKDIDFLANVSIIREEGTRTNMDHAQKKLSDHEATLLDFALSSQEEINLIVSAGESASMLNTFIGKNTSDGPLLAFMQTYLTKGSKVWSVTASYSPNEDEFTIDNMEQMLKSFTLK